MTIDEISREIRRQTVGLLNDGEITYATELALQAHGGISPEDVQRVTVTYDSGNLDIAFAVSPSVTTIDMRLA